MRVALFLCYDGTHFLGSQTQKQTDNTIFGTLQKALKRVGITTEAVPSGRTDKGVHASMQVAHLDLPPYWKEHDKLLIRLNQHLPGTIEIKKIIPVKPNFHARYDAYSRTYRYIIKRSKPTPFEYNYVSHIPEIDYLGIKENIQLFQGVHNFANFMKTGSEVKTTTREIYKSFAYTQKGYIILLFEANGFLRSQIRLMVAALISLQKEEIEEMLTCKTHYKLKPAPPNGLYLAKIKYKDIYV